ncbi:MAG: hypothetical protein IT437_06375 [Phycisphaerales bacterium]|nr:hypothetical protein [Phycisphaerales bacterium]
MTADRPTAPAASAPGPLSAENLKEVARARSGARRVRRAARVAAFSAWSIGLFAVLSLAWGLAAGDPTSIVLALGMAVITAVEFRGAMLFSRFEPRAGRLLGFNQLAFGALIVVYALWSMIDALRRPPDPQMAELQSQLGVGADVTRDLTVMVYGAVAAVGVLCFGATALYYFSRGRVVARFVRDTPEWVVDVLRAGT